MADLRRYERPQEVSFGGQTITVAPLRGLKRIRAFEDAIQEEIQAMAARVEKYARSGNRVSTEALLEAGADQVRLLKLGLPDVVTDELLEESTPRERQGLLTDVMFANNLGRMAGFLAVESLLEIGARLNRMVPEFPMPASSSSSSEPASAGSPSSTN